MGAEDRRLPKEGRLWMSIIAFMNVLTTLVISVVSAVMITLCIDMVEKMLKEEKISDFSCKYRFFFVPLQSKIDI